MWYNHLPVLPCTILCQSRNLSLSALDLNPLISCFGELLSKNCVVEKTEALIISSGFCYTAGSGKFEHNKRGARPTAEKCGHNA